MMYHFSNDDIEEFAKWLGIEGTDIDPSMKTIMDLMMNSMTTWSSRTEAWNDP